MNGVEVVANWFTPTVLFCVLNLVIGTIFITSTLKPPHSHPQNKDEQPPPPQLVRVSSFFERVKSFNLSRYQPDHAGPAQEDPQPQLVRVPSFFERVKSFNLSRSQHSDPDPAHHDFPAQEETQPPQLVRVPSFFERVKSFNLSGNQHSEPDPAHHAIPAQEEIHHEVTRSKSDTVSKVAPAAKVLQKSFSVKVSTEKEEEEEERRRPATVRERTAAEDEAVDEKADDFINRFRQQLKLQRLDSLLRYRGAGR